MTKENGREEVRPITPMEGLVALLAAKCKALISQTAYLLSEDPIYLQDGVSRALTIEEPPHLGEDDEERETAREAAKAFLSPKTKLSVQAHSEQQWTKGKIAEIRRYKRTHTQAEVGAKFDLTPSQVNYVLYGMKYQRPSKSTTKTLRANSRPGNGHMGPAEVQEIKARLIGGQSPSEIAKYMKISTATVHRYKAQFGSEAVIDQSQATPSNA